MKPGDKVTILNQDDSGNPIIEGEAVLIKCVRDAIPGGVPERWCVRFEGDPPDCVFGRFIYSEEEVAKVKGET